MPTGPRPLTRRPPRTIPRVSVRHDTFGIRPELDLAGLAGIRPKAPQFDRPVARAQPAGFQDESRYSWGVELGAAPA